MGPGPGDDENVSDSSELPADSEIDEVVRRAVETALAEHKRRRHAVAVWRDGKVVMAAPDEIPESENS